MKRDTCSLYMMQSRAITGELSAVSPDDFPETAFNRFNFDIAVFMFAVFWGLHRRADRFSSLPDFHCFI